MKKREKNIIVFGISEEEQLWEYSMEILTLPEGLRAKPKIVEVTRLGKIRDEDKPRLVRIKLESKFIRQKILASAHKLRNHPRYQNVYLKPDLTKIKRELQKVLWLDLKNRISTEPDKRWSIKGGI